MRIFIGCACVVLLCGNLLAQAPAPAAQPGGGRAGAGQRGGVMVGNFDPKQFRQQMLDAVRDKLEASDEDWTKLQPKVEKVMDAQHNARTGAGLAVQRSSAAGTSVRPMGGADSSTAAGKAMQEVRAAVEDKQVSDDEMSKKIAAFREARDKAKAELEAAQKDLKSAVSPRQEGALLMMGLLE